MEGSIFISYSHKDTETIDIIVDVIKKASDMSIWYDSRLRGGEHYFSVIADQIMKSSFFAFIVSGNSIMSDWCLRELEFAASERKTIVAIWLENISIPPRVKLAIQNTHYINYYSLSDEMFFDAISKAFLECAAPQQGGYGTNDDGRDRIWSETYFLDSEKLAKINRLLSAERQNKYSVCFRPENAYILGLAYELGIDVDTDLKRAEFYYKVSAYQGNYDGKYLYAAIRSKQANADRAGILAEMIDAAEHKSVCALTYLGDDYYYGRNGCEKDREKAYGFWRQAAQAGGIAAMYYMAYGHRKGECVKKDPELSCMYALVAMEYGFPRAYRILGFMYEDGEPFEQDHQKALEMYEEAIKRGDYLSLCYEGWIYGQNKDYDKQREAYEKAAGLAGSGKIKSGLPFFRMGYIYEYGQGVPQDTVKAVEYYILSAGRKNSSALKYTVSTIMTIRDQELREAYLRKAFALDCKGAAYELGNIEKERGTGKKLSEAAVKFYEKGAESGDLHCTKELLHNYSFVIGNGEDRNDRLQALTWFQFFFAHADEEFLQLLRKNNTLSTYYYAYAIELDYDPDVNLPDREFVQLYFMKSLEESPLHLNRIVSFVVDGYLFPEDSASGLTLDVLHAQEMLELLEGYLAGYRAYITANEASEASQLWSTLTERFQRGYNKISQCYAQGTSVQKSKKTAKKYRNKAAEVVQKMDRIAAADPT